MCFSLLLIYFCSFFYSGAERIYNEQQQFYANFGKNGVPKSVKYLCGSLTHKCDKCFNPDRNGNAEPERV